LGQIYYENGKAEASIEPNRRAVALAPNEALLLIGLARSLLATERADLRGEAEESLRAALRLEPSNAFAWNQLAVVADRNGQVGLARLATAEEAYNLGDLLRAHRFSDLAMRNLVRATPEWRRAFDISTITLPMATKAVRRGNDPRPLTLMPETPIASIPMAPEASEGLLRVVNSDPDAHDHCTSQTHAKH
jgi:predicted Zn-dependent protease